MSTNNRRFTRSSAAQNNESRGPEGEDPPLITTLHSSDDMYTYTNFQTSTNQPSTTNGTSSLPTNVKRMRLCTKCKNAPKEPHAVFCCGSIYCHVCLVELMTAAHQKKEQPTCVFCQKPMGEKPLMKNNRQQRTAEAVEATKRAHQKEATEGPPPKLRQSSNGAALLQPPGPVLASSLGPNLGVGMPPMPRPLLNPGHQSDQANKLTLQRLLALQKAREQPQQPQPSAFSGLPAYNPGVHFPQPQNGNQLTRDLFYSSAGGAPDLQSAATTNMIAMVNNASNGRTAPISSAGSMSSMNSVEPQHLQVVQAQSGQQIVKLEPMDTPMDTTPSIPITGSIQPTVAPQPQQGYIPPALYLQSNPSRSKLAKQVLFEEDFLPKMPHPYVEEAKKEEERLLQAERKAVQVDSKLVFGPPCAVCWDGSKEPQLSVCCEKVFCKLCITEEIRIRSRCPNCSKDFEKDEEMENIIRPLAISKAMKPVPQLGQVDFNIDMGKFKEKFADLDEFTLSALINKLSELREEKYKEKKNDPLRLLSLGYMDFVKKCKYEMATIQRQMEAALQDKKFIDGGYARECSLYGNVFSAVAGVNHPALTHPPLPSVDSNDYTPSLNPDELLKNDRLKKHFDSFCGLYFDVFNKYSIFSNEDPDFTAQNRVNAMAEVVDGITKYANVKKIGSLNYDTEQNPSMSIVSSLEFDHTGNRFVVAGVTKKIKIFHFDHFLENPKKAQYPAGQLFCQSKISNVSWSPDHDNILASSDYEGHVSVWDLENTKIVRTFKEHERRCWTVHFNNVEPKLMASGSDDSKVKLWNINCERSVAQIEARVNVCCVYFSPTNRNELVFGSADHCVHLYDIRKTSQPLNVFKGHRKAVSYVRYMNPNEVVSASTDSSLRVWNIKEGKCTKILKGHINEKNFVGLSGNGDHVMCGSENSKAFFYYKGLSEPIASYSVTNYSGPGKDTGVGNAPPDAFVSSVCWKKDSDYVLVANSQGKVQLLHIS